MNVAETILTQLGGGRFAAMTGCNHFVSDGYTLHMHIPRNGSRANRLSITLDPDDTYTMRFSRYTPGRLKVDSKKQIAYFVEDVTKEINTYHGVYCDQLQELFTEVTGMYTRL